MPREAKNASFSMLASSLNTAFGQRLQQCRHSKKMTQGVLADRAGLSRVSVANLESGRQNVTLQQVYLLAHSMDLPMASLVPSNADIESCSRAALRPLPVNCVSHADAQFLENSRALLTALLRGSNADAHTQTSD